MLFHYAIDSLEFRSAEARVSRQDRGSYEAALTAITGGPSERCWQIQLGPENRAENVFRFVFLFRPRVGRTGKLWPRANLRKAL